MWKQTFLFLVCLSGLSALNIRSQVKPVEASNFQSALPEIQVRPWDLDSQIKVQNLQNPQFADVIRKRLLQNKLAPKRTFDDTLEKKIQIGEARIKAGKATTTFKYNSQLTLKDYLLLQTDSYELRQIVEQNADVCLKMFRQSLKTHRLAQNDIVDAGALAFVLSYEIYFGKAPSREHLDWMRNKGRDILLKLASFQGINDAERQRTFEIFGVLTMYAQILQKRAERGDKAAALEATETAAEVLKEVWGNSTETIQMLPIGFTHKGQQIILEQKATQFFNNNPNLLTARKLSGGNVQIEAQYQSFLSQTHQQMALGKLAGNDLAACGTHSFISIYPFVSTTGKPNQKQMEGIYEVFKKAVLTSADIQAASDENKQIACEIFAIRAALLKKQLAENTDPNAVKILAEQFIDELFRAYSQDFKNYRMEGDNFVKTDSITALKQ